MKHINIRVVPDVEEDVFRDIQIGTNQSFLDLYQAIIKIFGFRGDQLASFYLSNDEWDKGHEIALMDMGSPSPSGLPTEMSQATIGDLILKKEQKIILVYDFLKMWCFFMEVLDVVEIEGDGTPKVIMSFGEAPVEDDKELPDLMEGIDLGENEDKKKSEYEDILDEFGDPDEFEDGGFENIDDLDI